MAQVGFPYAPSAQHLDHKPNADEHLAELEEAEHLLEGWMDKGIHVENPGSAYTLPKEASTIDDLAKAINERLTDTKKNHDNVISTQWTRSAKQASEENGSKVGHAYTKAPQG